MKAISLAIFAVFTVVQISGSALAVSGDSYPGRPRAPITNPRPCDPRICDPPPRSSEAASESKTSIADATAGAAVLAMEPENVCCCRSYCMPLSPGEDCKCCDIGPDVSVIGPDGCFPPHVRPWDRPNRHKGDDIVAECTTVRAETVVFKIHIEHGCQAS